MISKLFFIIGVLTTISVVCNAQTHPIYRCLSGSDSYVSTSKTCEGGTMQVLLGYAYDSQQPGTVPIYRCINSAGDNRFTTTSSTCAPIGGTNQAALGYIYTAKPSSPATTALYRCLKGTDNFTSTSTTCDGAGAGSLLGYVNSGP